MRDIIYMAPIRGITDCIFRTHFNTHFPGFDRAVAPFIATTKGHKPEKTILKELKDSQKNLIPVIPQIVSNNADDFIRLAQQLYDYGYPVINWNLGCPYPMVTRKGKGAGMLPYPQQIISFLDKVCPALQAKLSIKMRLGMHYNDEILQLLPLLNQYPVHEIIIHPRTAHQMYQGEVDLMIFEQCIAGSEHSLVYNGDITNTAIFKKHAMRYKTIHKWMIGRGMLYNPFLAAEIKGTIRHTEPRKREQLYLFHNELYTTYSETLCGFHQVAAKMKNIWSYLSHCFENSKKIQKSIKKTTSDLKYQRAVDTIFRNEKLSCINNPD
jgi:tRNA-dihydrouridine synthase B